MGDRVKCAIVGCSDPLLEQWRGDVEKLVAILEAEGLSVEVGRHLFDEYSPGLPRLKARELNSFFADSDVHYIFDVSGGDLTNMVLPYLDYQTIRRSAARFYGYSDLSTVLNAIVAKTGRRTFNYQARNLVYDHADEQLLYFRSRILSDSVSLDDLELDFIRGDGFDGRVLGGNTRCFLKLAGTQYWPSFDGAILLLESLGGGPSQMATALEQYSQLGVFDRINGVILGTFTTMEERNLSPSMKDLILDFLPKSVPVAQTRFIGHYTDARAVMLG